MKAISNNVKAVYFTEDQYRCIFGLLMLYKANPKPDYIGINHFVESEINKMSTLLFNWNKRPELEVPISLN